MTSGVSQRRRRYHLPVAIALSRQGSGRVIRRGLVLALQFFVVSSVVLVVAFRFIPPPTSAFMLHQHIDDLIEKRRWQAIEQQWVQQGAIAKSARKAVIASEDQLFYEHFGFDIDAILKAYRSHQHGGRLRGASTLSQQVAKNLFLSPARNWGRKILEIWFTLLIELLWDKQRILEVYLNIAELGDHVYGIEAASRHYFGVSARQLSAEQAALLAATLPNPMKYRADKPNSQVLRRQQWILAQMHHITDP